MTCFGCSNTLELLPTVVEGSQMKTGVEVEAEAGPREQCNCWRVPEPGFQGMLGNSRDTLVGLGIQALDL